MRLLLVFFGVATAAAALPPIQVRMGPSLLYPGWQGSAFQPGMGVQATLQPRDFPFLFEVTFLQGLLREVLPRSSTVLKIGVSRVLPWKRIRVGMHVGPWVAEILQNSTRYNHAPFFLAPSVFYLQEIGSRKWAFGASLDVPLFFPASSSGGFGAQRSTYTTGWGLGVAMALWGIYRLN